MPVFVYDNGLHRLQQLSPSTFGKETTTPSNSKGTWACKYKNSMVILL
jgi:hypothetical protein